MSAGGVGAASFKRSSTGPLEEAVPPPAKRQKVTAGVEALSEHLFLEIVSFLPLKDMVQLTLCNKELYRQRSSTILNGLNRQLDFKEDKKGLTTTDFKLYAKTARVLSTKPPPLGSSNFLYNLGTIMEPIFPEFISWLVEANSGLKSLTISGCEQSHLPEDFFEPLLQLENFESLHLCSFSNLPPITFKPLESINTLEELSLSYCQFSGGSDILPPVGRMLHLETLRLDNCRYDKADVCDVMSPLAPLTQLVDLGLNNSFYLTDSDIATIGTFINLQRLNLNRGPLSGIVGVDFQPLGRLEHLISLSLTCCASIGDYDLRFLIGLSYLQELDLRFCPKLTSACFQYIGALTNLKILQIQPWGEIPTDHLKLLYGLKKLETLEIDPDRLKPQDFVELRSNLPKLTTIKGYFPPGNLML